MAARITFDSVAEWLYGLLKVMIAGGAGSVVSAFGATIVDGKDFQAFSPNFYHMMWITFMLHFMINGLMYLQKTPLPDLVEVQTSRQVVTVPGLPPVVTEIEKKTTTVDASAIKEAGEIPTARP